MKDLVISDHALVRWLERGRGFDMQFFQKVLEEQCGHAPTDSELLDWLNKAHGIDILAMHDVLYATAKIAAGLGIRYYPSDEGVMVYDVGSRNLVTVLTTEMYEEHRAKLKLERHRSLERIRTRRKRERFEVRSDRYKFDFAQE